MLVLYPLRQKVSQPGPLQYQISYNVSLTQPDPLLYQVSQPLLFSHNVSLTQPDLRNQVSQPLLFSNNVYLRSKFTYPDPLLNLEPDLQRPVPMPSWNHSSLKKILAS
jgi:hypothetical protein